MVVRVDRYVGSNGDILLPVAETVNNTSDLISIKGIYYIAQTSEIVAIEAGNPMGLLLTLTYPAAP